MKKLVVIAALAVALTAAPASAASNPKRPADYTVKCGKHTAQVWIDRVNYQPTSWAADNPCGKWLGIGWGYNGASDSSSQVLYVAPGARFGPARHDLPNGDWTSAFLTKTPDFCNQGEGSLVVHKGTHGRFDRGGC